MRRCNQQQSLLVHIDVLVTHTNMSAQHACTCEFDNEITLVIVHSTASSMVNDVSAQSNDALSSWGHDRANVRDTIQGNRLSASDERSDEGGWQTNDNKTQSRCRSTKQTNDEVANQWYTTPLPSFVCLGEANEQRNKEERQQQAIIVTYKGFLLGICHERNESSWRHWRIQDCGTRNDTVRCVPRIIVQLNNEGQT